MAALVDLADQRRQQYERYQPIFFRPAAGAREKHAPYLRSLLTEKNVIAHVHERDDGVVDALAVPTI